MGQAVGYVRVSTVDQNLARQLPDMKLDTLFEDKVSGKDTKRPGLEACIKHCREGDTLHVHSLDRLARNLADLLRLVDTFTGDGVALHFHKENLIFNGDTNPMQQLMLSMMGAFAQFERELIRERQREGIAIAKAAGKYKGRVPSLNTDKVDEVKELKAGGVPIAEIARRMGVSRGTVYAALK